jgi:hypothetical protein
VKLNSSALANRAAEIRRLRSRLAEAETAASISKGLEIALKHESSDFIRRELAFCDEIEVDGICDVGLDGDEPIEEVCDLDEAQRFSVFGHYNAPGKEGRECFADFQKLSEAQAYCLAPMFLAAELTTSARVLRSALRSASFASGDGGSAVLAWSRSSSCSVCDVFPVARVITPPRLSAAHG